MHNIGGIKLIVSYDINSIKVIGKNIEDSFKKHGVIVKVNYVNNYKVIAIQDNHVNLWLRLYPCGNKLNADISTIEFTDSLRDKDIFTTMCKRLKNCKYIENLRVTGVCTPEMQSWCRKYHLKEVNPYDYLIKF